MLNSRKTHCYSIFSLPSEFGANWSSFKVTPSCRTPVLPNSTQLPQNTQAKPNSARRGMGVNWGQACTHRTAWQCIMQLSFPSLESGGPCQNLTISHAYNLMALGIGTVQSLGVFDNQTNKLQTSICSESWLQATCACLTCPAISQRCQTDIKESPWHQLELTLTGIFTYVHYNSTKSSWQFP